MGHNAPDGVRLLVREGVVLPEGQGNGGAGAGVHVLKYVGPLLPQVNVDKGVHHAVQLADGGLEPLLHRHQPGRGPLGGGGHGAHVLKIGAVERAALGVAGHGQLGGQDALLILAHQNGIPLQPVVSDAVVLEIAQNGADLRGVQAGEQGCIGLVAAPDDQRHGKNDDSGQGGGQYDAHLGAHVFEKVLYFFPGAFQLCFHTVFLRPFLSNGMANRPYRLMRLSSL